MNVPLRVNDHLLSTKPYPTEPSLCLYIRAVLVRNQTTFEFGTATKVREKVDTFFVELTGRATEVIQRCRRELQALADPLLLFASQAFVEIKNVDLIFRSDKSSRIDKTAVLTAPFFGQSVRTRMAT